MITACMGIYIVCINFLWKLLHLPLEMWYTGAYYLRVGTFPGRYDSTSWSWSVDCLKIINVIVVYYFTVSDHPALLPSNISDKKN
jgi:hypothetical protein